jgi:SAM-dependent methyltransferase
MAEIDFEHLAAGYRHRPTSAAGRERAGMAAAAAGLGSGDLAVDVGGGRGAHAAVFATSGARALVVDRSPAMARCARAAGVAAVVGDGRRLPLRDGSCRLAYWHVALHYGGWREMLDEGIRVAAPGGAVWSWTFTREHFDASFLAHWFPSVGPIDSARFPDPDDLAAHLGERGLTGVARVERDEVVERTAGSWLAAVEGGFVSTLQVLPPGELESGLAEFRGRHPDPAEILSYRLAYVAVWGRVPSLALR